MTYAGCINAVVKQIVRLEGQCVVCMQRAAYCTVGFSMRMSFGGLIKFLNCFRFAIKMDRLLRDCTSVVGRSISQCTPHLKSTP